MNVHVSTGVHQKFVMELADLIERRNRFHFDMGAWSSCVAGICFAAFARPSEWVGNDSRQREFSKQLLGLSDEDADVMFTPSPSDLGLSVNRPLGSNNLCHLYDVTPQWAANMLRYYAFTGKVNWTETRPEGYRTMGEIANRETFEVALARFYEPVPLEALGQLMPDRMLAAPEHRELASVD